MGRAQRYVHRVKGANGPSVIDLNLARNGDKACVPADQVLLESITSNPAGYYLSLKTGITQPVPSGASWLGSPDQRTRHGPARAEPQS